MIVQFINAAAVLLIVPAELLLQMHLIRNNNSEVASVKRRLLNVHANENPVAS